MTSTQSVPQNSMNPDVAAGVAQFLSQVVMDLTALSIDGKQAHWHVRGPNFQSVHELLDVVVDHARHHADAAAERVIALGLPIDSRIQTVAEKAKTPKMTAGFRQSDDVIAEVVAQIDAVLETLRTAVEELESLDQVSQDVAIEIARSLEQDRWFLYAHISAE